MASPTLQSKVPWLPEGWFWRGRGVWHVQTKQVSVSWRLPGRKKCFQNMQLWSYFKLLWVDSKTKARELRWLSRCQLLWVWHLNELLNLSRVTLLYPSTSDLACVCACVYSLRVKRAKIKKSGGRGRGGGGGGRWLALPGPGVEQPSAVTDSALPLRPACGRDTAWVAHMSWRGFCLPNLFPHCCPPPRWQAR